MSPFWRYVGGGCWELQALGSFLGCVYGSKFDEKRSLTVEKVSHGPVRRVEGGPDQRDVVVEKVWSMGGLDCSLDWAQMLVEAHVERLLRRDMALLGMMPRRIEEA